MDCGYKEKTILFFYGELPPDRTAEAERHAAACADCASVLALLSGLSGEFRAFRPRVPELSSEEMISAAGGASFLERLFPVFRRAAAAAAFTSVFLIAFQAVTPWSALRQQGIGEGAALVREAELDSALDGVDSALYALKDDMSGLSQSDFEYGCAEVEDQKGRMNV